MDWILHNLGADVLVRVVATALIVIGVALAVERFGAKIGGALAGLPIVIGPGFFFLIREHGIAFGAEAAAYSLISLCATQAFLLAYCAAARTLSAGTSLALASMAWVGAALLMSGLPPRPVLGMMLFLATLLAARRMSRAFLRASAPTAAKGGPWLLAIRGLAAGLLVAVVTFAAERLGPAWSGLMVTFPIGFTVVSITIHQRSGPGTAIATLHAAMLGVASLAAFSFTLSTTIMALGAEIGFMLSLGAGVMVTVFLTWQSARLRGGERQERGARP